MSDENERSVASTGAVEHRTFDDWYLSMELESFEPELRAAWDAGQSAARFTDAEREAIEAGAIAIDRLDEEMDGFSSGGSRTLRALLERLK